MRYTREPVPVGGRAVLRRRLPGGGLSDLLGVVEHWAGGLVCLRDRHGVLHELAVDDVVAAKPVPPAPERR